VAVCEKDRSVSQAIKRGVDILLASCGLLITVPVSVSLAAVIRWESPGPAIFRQPRAGKNGSPFVLYKFRTMVDKAPDGFVSQDDPRITRVGRFLRMTSLDEIPQLWNVIKGDMSLVGPRPDRVHRAETYTDRIRQRLEVRPGIMGWAQLHDGRSLTWEERYEYDLEYVSNWSLWWDLRIMWWSIVRGNMLQREGLRTDGKD